jgi:hypothetical protein
MSSLQNRMYNHEVTPPTNAWEKIAAALDESHLQNEFPGKLYNTTVPPPASAWDKINAVLDNGGFQHEFPSRLYNMEVAPPAGIWDKVAASLSETTTPVQAPVRRLSPFFRYAAAAVFIGAIAWGIIRLAVNSNNTGDGSVMASGRNDSNLANDNKTPGPATTPIPSIATNENEDDDDAIEKSKTLLAKLDRPARKTSRAITSSLITTSNNDDVIAERNLSQTIYAYADHIPNLADRYVMLMTPDGNIIRMSKKWSELLCCVSGEEQDEGCKDQLKKWQEKMATSTLAPSPGNFMDILGLARSLDESNDL